MKSKEQVFILIYILMWQLRLLAIAKRHYYSPITLEFLLGGGIVKLKGIVSMLLIVLTKVDLWSKEK